MSGMSGMSGVSEACVAFMVTLYKDHHRASEMLKTLGQCKLPGTVSWPGHVELITLDATEDAPEGAIPTFTRGQIPEKHYALRRLAHITYVNKAYDHRAGLPECLNDGIKVAIDGAFEYVAWIHPDMDFSADPLWLDSCIRYLAQTPMCGKVSPWEEKTFQAAHNRMKNGMAANPVQGNACPWVMRVQDCETLLENEGYVFDPNYKLMHFEDWDLINRLQTELGLVASILPWATVVHEGMGTRKHHDYEDSLQVNNVYYQEKWGLRGKHL